LSCKAIVKSRFQYKTDANEPMVKLHLAIKLRHKKELVDLLVSATREK